jgi:hypothetical protein
MMAHGDVANLSRRTRMSILGKIFGRIFPGAHAQQPAQPAPSAVSPASSAAPASASPARPQQAPTAPQPPAQSAAQPAAQSAQPAGATSAATMERVDVEKVLDGLAANNPQKLNWRSSIVDLMKLTGMDSTLQERRELADELGYKGDKNDTATMNTWLHKEVMRKIEENGGKVPDNLKD